MSSANKDNQDLLSGILQNLQERFFTIEIKRTVPKATANKLKINNCLMLCGNFSQLIKFSSTSFISDVIVPSGFFTFVVVEISLTEAETFPRKMWSKHVYNVIVITQLNTKPHVLSFTPFKKEKCKDTSTEIVNQFTNGKWNSSMFFPEKFTNLHNCTLKAAALDNPPIVIKKTPFNKTVELDGFEVVFLRELSKALNFQVDIESSDTDHGSIYEENQTFTVNLRHAITGESDLILGSYYLSAFRSKYLTNSQSYRFDETKAVRPNDPLYSPIENLMRPFNFWLFVTLSGILFAGTFAIALFRKLNICDRSLDLSLNLLVVFLGGSQIKLSTHNSLRILFIAFAFFCLILRTLYQGLLYSIMQTEDRKKGIVSIDEMIKREFNFFVTTSFSQQTNGFKIHHR